MYSFIQELIEFIKATNLFRIVDIYRNEFLDIDWNPQFPACLIRMESYDRAITDSTGSSLRERATLILYIANRIGNNDSSSALELALTVFEEISNAGSDDGNYNITQDNIKFVETGSGIDIYSIQISVK